MSYIYVIYKLFSSQPIIFVLQVSGHSLGSHSKYCTRGHDVIGHVDYTVILPIVFAAVYWKHILSALLNAGR